MTVTVHQNNETHKCWISCIDWESKNIVPLLPIHILIQKNKCLNAYKKNDPIIEITSEMEVIEHRQLETVS